MRAKATATISRLMIAMVVLPASIPPAPAAELDGVVMPDTRLSNGTRLRLNGIGLRTYSIFNVPIYVAGLYLEQRSDNPQNILRSSEKKLLDIRFVHDIDAKQARQAWRDGLEHNCQPPDCYLNPADVERFLAAVPPLHAGDDTVFAFTSKGLEVTINSHPMGEITDTRFAEIMLGTFIGPVPATRRLKHELLGAPD